jgi:phosphoenolpyruvate carboxylase
VLKSTGFTADGLFTLLLPAPVSGGTYTCHLPSLNSTGCLRRDMSAYVTVDPVRASFATMKAQVAQLQTQLQTQLTATKAQLQSQLTAGNQDFRNELKTTNSKLKSTDAKLAAGDKKLRNELNQLKRKCLNLNHENCVKNSTVSNMCVNRYMEWFKRVYVTVK